MIWHTISAIFCKNFDLDFIPSSIYQTILSKSIILRINLLDGGQQNFKGTVYFFVLFFVVLAYILLKKVLYDTFKEVCYNDNIHNTSDYITPVAYLWGGGGCGPHRAALTLGRHFLYLLIVVKSNLFISYLFSFLNNKWLL